MTDKEDVRVMLRLPGDLHADVAKFAEGDGRRPKASLNATLIFLIRSGLRQQQSSEERGESEARNAS